MTRRKRRRARKSRTHRGGMSLQNDFIQTNYEVLTLDYIKQISTNEIPKHLRYKMVRMSRGNKLYSGHIIKHRESYYLNLVYNLAVQDNQPLLGLYRDIKQRFFSMNKMLLLDANDKIYLLKGTSKSTEENNKIVTQLEGIVKQNPKSTVKEVFLSREEQKVYESRDAQPADIPQNPSGYNRYNEMFSNTRLQGQPPDLPTHPPFHSQENVGPVTQYENSRA